MVDPSLDLRGTGWPYVRHDPDDSWRRLQRSPRPSGARRRCSRRLCSAKRPRIAADAAETGDWLHVDVCLGKRPRYAAFLFAGSRFDAGVLEASYFSSEYLVDGLDGETSVSIVQILGNIVRKNLEPAVGYAGRR